MDVRGVFEFAQEEAEEDMAVHRRALIAEYFVGC